MLRDLLTPEGGFSSALDADSEGVEGRYYVWTPDEVGEEAAGLFSVTTRWDVRARDIGAAVAARAAQRRSVAR